MNRSLPFLNWHLADAFWLLALAVYVFAGMMLAPFHGDEAMQVYMSHDYVIAFMDKQPERLMVSPPYYIDEDNWLRILNGSINRYAIGVSWYLTGFTAGDLPPRPGWDWGLSYDRNVETGHRPAEGMMQAARFSSTLFLSLSTAVIFAIGWQFGGRLPAYLISGLYTLNPVILLNGRRAMMEGSLLFFGLLALLIAILISRKRTETLQANTIGAARALRQYARQGLQAAAGWLALALAAGVTLASKHSGLVFVAGAFGWIFLAEIVQFFMLMVTTQPALPLHRRNLKRQLASLLVATLKLIVTGIVAAVLFTALSPALWNDPAARLRDLIEQRQGLLDMQVNAEPLAPTTMQQRLEGIITQPFLTPVAHYEVAAWAGYTPITAEIERYLASPLSGLQFGVPFGLPLTLLAGFGIIVLFVPRLRPDAGWAAGMLLWLVATVVSLLINPLPWQRYYLPLIPVATVLAGIGLTNMIRLFVQKPTQPRAQSTVASSTNLTQTG